MVRTGARHPAVDCCAGPPRNRRSAAGSRQPGADQREFLRAGARARDRHLVWLHVDHCGHRSRAGRMVHRARFVAMGVLHQCSAGAVRACCWLSGKSRRAGPAKQASRFDWPGGLLAALGFGGIVFALIESLPLAGAVGAIALIALLYWEAHASVADGPAPPVPFPQFQRSQSAHPLSLLRLERRSLLLPARFDPGARLFADAGRGRPAAFHPVDVPAVALVRRTSRSIWRQGSAGGGPPDRRRRIRAVREAGYRRLVLDHVLPRGAGAWDSAWRSAWPR